MFEYAKRSTYLSAVEGFLFVVFVVFAILIFPLYYDQRELKTQKCVASQMDTAFSGLWCFTCIQSHFGI